MTGDFAVQLFDEQTGEVLSAVRNWTPKHVRSNNIEKTKGETGDGHVSAGSDSCH